MTSETKEEIRIALTLFFIGALVMSVMFYGLKIAYPYFPDYQELIIK